MVFLFFCNFFVWIFYCSWLNMDILLLLPSKFAFWIIKLNLDLRFISEFEFLWVFSKWLCDQMPNDSAVSQQTAVLTLASIE